MAKFEIIATPETVAEGNVVELKPDFTPDAGAAAALFEYEWELSGGTLLDPMKGNNVAAVPTVHWDTTDLRPSPYVATLKTRIGGRQLPEAVVKIIVNRRALSSGDTMPVAMRRTENPLSIDVPLWVVIRQTTEAMSFENYSKYMDLILCAPGQDRAQNPVEKKFEALRKLRFLPYNDTDAYRLLKIATEAFLVVSCGVDIKNIKFTEDDYAYLTQRDIDTQGTELPMFLSKYLKSVNGTPGDQTLPYLALIRDKLRDERLKDSIFPAENDDQQQECVGILKSKFTSPCLLELIWSYWHEQGMLVQTLNAVSQRFQNIRGPGERDPLAMMEIDPLRPLNNLLWGYIQDEQHRLSIVRRAYEYDHHYGLSLQGRAVPTLRSVDSRSKFLEAFHNVLALCSIFFKEDDDTTVKADGFPILNALKDVHLLLSQGAHNQFGDLPSTARQEMLVQQWLLARPEFREFLPTRVMVAYPERWMDRVDAMKSLQGWNDVSVMHFRNLGKFGEQILLSIRFGAWSDVNDPLHAANWARFWRPALQGYIHAYRSTTGVDLTTDVTDTSQAADRYLQPSMHLSNRVAMQQRDRLPLPAPSANGATRASSARAVPKKNS